MRHFFIRLISTALLGFSGASSAGVDLVYRLPTGNDALFRGDNKAFFTYVDRTFEGVTSQPWEAGTYGFVRNPFRLNNGKIMFSRLHEGIDISPVKRDETDEPLDIVHPVAPGTVVYTNNGPGLSNYGRYVVVKHCIPEGDIYTVYAHLAEVRCSAGQRVGTGNELGRLGYSGAGINKTRAHLHLEICFLINRHYDKFSPPANKHGIYNGLNLAGFDIAKVLLHCKNGATLSLRQHLATLPEHYRVRVPCIGTMDLLQRHPFLYKGDWKKRPAALDIAFTAEGVPLAVYPADRAVAAPEVISCKPQPTLQQNCTANRLKNNSKNAALTASGRRYIETFLWLEGKYPPAAQSEDQNSL
ncbi:MAG: M23 family metallopeptidase [Akkermansia sp.]|nr:M23 family metallopeptidase [Akkermansia sp.]